MKHNIRDPKTGRFIKKSVVENKIPRDPKTGRFISSNPSSNTHTPSWKDEFDRCMAEHWKWMGEVERLINAIF